MVFDRMKERDVLTWTVMIGAYAGSGRGVEAYDLYLKMKEEGIQPDIVTYVSLLNDCKHRSFGVGEGGAQSYYASWV